MWFQLRPGQLAAPPFESDIGPRRPTLAIPGPGTRATHPKGGKPQDGAVGRESEESPEGRAGAEDGPAGRTAPYGQQKIN